MQASVAFQTNIARARRLVALYDERRKSGVVHDGIADILRAAVVLAVGALDAYIHDKVSENIVPFVRRALVKGSPSDLDPLEKLLKKADVQTRDYLYWLTLARPFVKVRQAIDSELGTESLQNPGSIQTALTVIGKRNVWSQCATLMKTKEKQIRDDIAALATRRNQIVHEGDMEKSRLRKHKERAIDRDWVLNQLDFSEALVSALELVK